MSLETLNLSLFHVINGAQDASQFIIRLAIFLLMISSIFSYSSLHFMVLWRSRFKNRVIKSVFLTCVSLLVGYVISLFYHHSRPFVMGVGTTLLNMHQRHLFQVIIC